ncbi:MAG: hypothetical protein QM582_16505 [Micropruina sp.]|uniref:hypothetical protein n=1 Tax=Micropruina sp. TaxID=2737536 RepID=UPI0039E3B8DD
MNHPAERAARAVPTLPLVLGVTDGMLNALTLAGGALFHGDADGLTLLLALRVGIAALVTSTFTMFVADYAERRSSLVRAARQLNLTVRGQLAATNLGRHAFHESLVAMAVAAGASLAGAFLPLALGASLPGPSWTVVPLTVGLLGVFGWLLGGVIAGRRAVWAVAMTVGGIAVTAIGVWLDIA